LVYIFIKTLILKLVAGLKSASQASSYLIFSISLHEKDKDLLSQIQNFFGFGGIHKHGKDSLKYRVSSLNDLQIVINHFDKYPLLTQKLKDYKLFKLAFSLFNNKGSA
jgi:hypothetical protein